MKHPDPKKHQIISFVKSGVRVAGSVWSVCTLLVANPVAAIAFLALFYGAAEIIGIYEELV